MNRCLRPAPPQQAPAARKLAPGSGRGRPFDWHRRRRSRAGHGELRTLRRAQGRASAAGRRMLRPGRATPPPPGHCARESCAPASAAGRRSRARRPPLPQPTRGRAVVRASMRPETRRPPLAAALLLLLRLGVLAGLRGAAAAASGGELAVAADGNCRNMKVMDVVHTPESACYCYIPSEAIHLKNIWSSIQVKINSTELFRVVPVPEESNCQDAETLFAFFKCIIQNIWQWGVSNGSVISVDQYGERTCFRVQLENKALYTVTVQQTMLDKKLFLLFVAGGLLFHFAHNLSRSVVFYYSSGVTFGVLATLVFLLLMLKRFIPKLSTFWILMSGCWFFSLYLFYNLKEDLKLLWYDYTHYLLGYVLIAGSVSFAVCYQHGPLASEQSMNLLMWTLQLTGLILIYIGIAIPEVAYAVVATVLCSKLLHYPLQVFRSVGRRAHRWFFKAEKPEVRFLTEEEYREQGESETIKALEELRAFCRSPGFPSWVAVVKLQSPQKFAHFVLGLPHVSPEEMNAHEEQYGAFLEDQLFTSETEPEPDRQTGPFQRDVEEEPEQIPPQNCLPIHSREFL